MALMRDSRDRYRDRVGRVERKLFQINDEIARLRKAIRLTQEELGVLQHLDDDAQRDAAVGGPIERDDARATSADVARFEAVVAALQTRIGRLQEKRADLLAKLD
jgi:uncharacterized membrane protein YccC